MTETYIIYIITKRNGDRYQVLIDRSDWDLIENYTWTLTKTGYAYSGTLYKRKENYYLHKIIAERMGINCKEIDHKNQNKLDNRRCNLRNVTDSQNQMNTNKKSNNVSGFKGVSEMKNRKKKWRAQLMVNGKTVYQECFYSAENAAKAYDAAAIRYHGEYANLNFPPVSKTT